MPTRRAVLAATAFAALAGATTVGSGCSARPRPAEPTLSAALADRLSTAIRTAMDEAGIPGALIGVWSPEGNYVEEFGAADLATAAPMNIVDFSRIGSVTKTFTGTALLQLVDRGQVALDDPISRYVDGIPDGDVITVRQLATMRSGLVDYSTTAAFASAVAADPSRGFTARELLAFAADQPPDFPPDAQWAYNNSNYVILGVLIESVSRIPIADYLAANVLGPLGLNHTSFPTGTQFPAPHPRGYTDPLQGSGPPIDATGFSASHTGAAGAMISTLEDMRVWVAAVADGALISPASQRERLRIASGTDLRPGTGYGIGLLTTAGWVGHNGSVPGYQTVAVFLPPRRIALVVFINTDIAAPDGGHPSSAIARAVTSVLTPDHVYEV